MYYMLVVCYKLNTLHSFNIQYLYVYTILCILNYVLHVPIIVCIIVYIISYTYILIHIYYTLILIHTYSYAYTKSIIHIYIYTYTPINRVFHVLPDNLGGSAIWAAQRVPDDHVAVVANSFIIGR